MVCIVCLRSISVQHGNFPKMKWSEIVSDTTERPLKTPYRMCFQRFPVLDSQLFTFFTKVVKQTIDSKRFLGVI